MDMNYLTKDARLSNINNICQAISDMIKRQSKKGDHSLNIFLEQNFIPIYNIAFDGNFDKCVGVNYPAIDLIDNSSSVGIQISSDTTKNKIKKTFEKYFKNQDQLNLSKLKFFFFSQDISAISNITIAEIETYLNSAATKTRINKNLSAPYGLVTLNPNLFNPKEDILCFDFINTRYHNLDNVKLDLCIKILEEVWPFNKITIEDLSNFHSNRKLPSINEKLINLSKSETIELITKTFIPLKIIPYHVFTTIKYMGNVFGYSIENFILFTKNKNLYDDVKIEISSDERPLINFLLRNKIHNLHLLGINESLNIKSLYNPSTSCPICDYDEFLIDFGLFYDSANTIINDQNIENSFYKAYFFAEFGQYQKAVDQLQTIWHFSKNSNKYHIAYFISLYTLKRLKNSQYIRFKDDSPINALPVDLQNDINRDFTIPVSDTITEEEIKVMDYYYHFKHINSQHSTLELIKKTEKALRVDSNGGFSSIDLGLEWNMITFSSVYLTKHNLLLFDTKFSEIPQIVFKSFQSLLSLSLLRHEKSIKPRLWDTFIKYTISVLSESELKECLTRFNSNSPILIENKNIDIIYNIVKNILSNLAKCKNSLQSYFKTQGDNCSLSDNINQAFRNICIYMTYIDFSVEQFNVNLELLLETYNVENLLWPSSHSLIVDLINKKQGEITLINSETIKTIYEKHSGTFLDLELYNSNFFNLGQFDYNNTEIDTLFDLWFYRKADVNKELLKSAYENSLNAAYNFHFVRLGVITDLIGFEVYRDKTIDYLYDIIKNKYDFHLNSWIIQSFLEIAYHENLDLSNPEYQKLLPTNTKEKEYYNWLFNLNSFDYTRFDPYWLLKYPYDIFLKKIKEVPQVKINLIAYLKKNEDGKLSNLYFNYFSD